MAENDPVARTGRPEPAQPANDRWERMAAIVLALAAMLSAWAAYQATRWGGQQADAYAASTAHRAEAARHAGIASRQTQIDVSTFLAWLDAYDPDDRRLSDFLRARFRPEFKRAFEPWLATRSADGGPPAGTPFDSDAYHLAEQDEADAHLAQAEAALAEARTDNQVADDFVLVAVVFASVLFIAGVATRWTDPRIRAGLAALTAAIFLAALGAELLLPQSIGR